MYHIKVSHVDSRVVYKILDMLDGKFGELSSLVVIQVKFHDCLGIKINYSNKVKVMISMIYSIYIILHTLLKKLAEWKYLFRKRYV